MKHENNRILMIIGEEVTELAAKAVHAFAPGFTAWQRCMKRTGDILLSLLLLLLLSPVFAVLALVVYAADRGPVFYRQVRLTKGGKPFMLYKFRSLAPDASQDLSLVAEDDGRLTRPGRFLRRSHLDELPQLWNVLMGSMALVGPRPERPEIYERLHGEFPQFAGRLKVKAGITGYAQVYGQYDTSYADKLSMDIFYIGKASLLLDLRLLLMTPRAIIRN